MKKLKGISISEGVAIGKIHILKNEDAVDFDCGIECKEMEKFNKAIDMALLDVEKQIDLAKEKFDARIFEIFEAHKFIISDPVLIENTKNYIKKNMSALESYDKAVHEFIVLIEDSKNEYMLGRIIDIIDASDKVKNHINKTSESQIYNPKEKTIIVTEALKPSIIFSNSNDKICGYIISNGYFHQHSGIIARAIKLPCVIYNDIFNYVEDNQYILIDGFKGEIIINPTNEHIKEKERSYNCEL